MPLQYLSPAWTEELKIGLQAGMPARGGGVSASVNFRHMGAPGGGQKYLYLNFQNGVANRVEAGEGAGPAAEFVITGAYPTFVQVLNGSLDAGRALQAGKLRFQGNMLRAMRLTPVIDGLIIAVKSIPTVY